MKMLTYLYPRITAILNLVIGKCDNETNIDDIKVITIKN